MTRLEWLGVLVGLVVMLIAAVALDWRLGLMAVGLIIVLVSFDPVLLRRRT